MTVRNKLVACLVGWLLFVIIVMALAGAVSRWFGFALFVGLVGFGPYSMSIRCPECSHPAASRYGLWGPWLPRRCFKCGHRLD
jgi:hypothetical protein